MIVRHIRDKHRLEKDSRQQLIDYLKQWQWQYDFQTVPLPLDGQLPQPVLPISDGFKCNDCAYKTINRSVIRKHCNQQHNKQRLKDKELFQAVQLQTWFAEKRARYWVVDATAQSRDVNNDSGSDSDALAAIKADIQEWKAQEEGIYQASTVPAEVDKWLQHVRWEAVLANSKLDLVQTAAFAAAATATETELHRLLECWERILQRSLNTLVAVADYKDILQWWQSPKHEEASPRPFEQPLTLAKYNATFRRFLCYVFRAAPANQEGESETGLVLSSQQWIALTKIRQLLAQPVTVAATVTDDHQLTVALIGLLVTLVAQDLCQLPQYHSPVMHFLAIRGINSTKERFATAQDYTPILAQMLWMIRLLMLEIAIPEVGWPELGLRSRKEIGAVAGAVAERIQRLRKSFLCTGSFSPASSILSQLAFGKKLNKVTPAESNIHWSDDRQTVFYTGKGVAMAYVRSMCQDLTIELEGLLYGLLFRQPVEPLPLPLLVDSMGSAQQFQQRGYSFIDHPDNARWKVDWGFVWERMLLAKKEEWLAGKESGSGCGQWQWAEQRCKAYLAREKQFLLKLMVAMHFTGGQPGRSPEVGSIKVQNSTTSNRNLFIINGRVAVAMAYDKSQRLREKTQYIFRCFPDRLSQVIIQYLVYLLPFTRVISKTQSEFLFSDQQGPWIQDQLSRAVAVATTKHLGVRLTVASWRQVAIAICDEHLRRASQIWRQAQDEEDDEGVAVAEASDGDVEQSLFEHTLVWQSAHSKPTAVGHYAIDSAFLSRLGPDLVNAFTQASRAWHAFLRLESKGAAVAVAVAKRPASPIEQPSKRPKLEVSPGLRGLQKILGPDAQPMSKEQAHALELVHTATATQPQIIVLGTGSGKSLLFFSVAAMASSQTVIVVVPFAALVDDLVVRAQRHQLTCEEWQWQRQWKQLPQLLIVSADRASEGDFLHFAKELELSQRLAHVFFDECHVAVTDTSYRAKLRELWQLRYLTCRFTCLTATLLVSLEPVLRANLLLMSAQLYRQSTMRPTTRYQVVDCHRKGLWEVAEPLIRPLPLPLASRGIIYVRSYTQGEGVAEALNCPFYKATATDKQELLEQWASGSGSGGWIVATGALGTGINIARVLYVVHLGRPYGLTSFMQQAGRGGRAGEISDSIVILPSSDGDSGSGQFPALRQELVNTYSVEAQDEAALTEYLESRSCRRAVLAKHLDGHIEGTDCLTTDSIHCDRCQELLEQQSSGSDSGPESGAKAIYQALRAETQREEQLERFHQLLQAHCVYCQLIREEGEGESHCHRDCPYAAEKGCDIQAYRQWRSRLKLAKRDQCFRCGLSQRVCTAVEEQRQCTYPHLILPGLFFLHKVGQLLEICQEVGFQGEEGRQRQWQWQWLNQEGEGLFGRREVNWMRVWRRVGEIYCEIEDEKSN